MPLTRRQFINGTAISALIGTTGCLNITQNEPIEFEWEQENDDLLLTYANGPTLDNNNLAIHTNGRELSRPFGITDIDAGTTTRVIRNVDFRYGNTLTVYYDNDAKTRITPEHEAYPLPELSISWSINTRPDPAELIIEHEDGDTVNGEQLLVYNQNTGTEHGSFQTPTFEPGDTYTLTQDVFEPGDTLEIILTSKPDSSDTRHQETILDEYYVADPLS